MALDYKESADIEKLKQKHKLEIEKLSHGNKMARLDKMLQIAAAGGIHGSDDE